MPFPPIIYQVPIYSFILTVTTNYFGKFPPTRELLTGIVLLGANK